MKYSVQSIHLLTENKDDRFTQFNELFAPETLVLEAVHTLLAVAEHWFVHAKYVKAWWGNHPNCIAAIIKRGWYNVRSNANYYTKLHLADHSFVPFRSDKPWWRQLSWRMFCTPRLWAKRHNTVENGWKEDKNTVHFYDFATELKLKEK